MNGTISGLKWSHKAGCGHSRSALKGTVSLVPKNPCRRNIGMRIATQVYLTKFRPIRRVNLRAYEELMKVLTALQTL
jgi:hypothetical protein